MSGGSRYSIDMCSGALLPKILTFALPLMLHARFGGYRSFYLRRFAGLPAWDLNLYVRS